MSKYTVHSAVHIFFLKDDKVLLARRHNTGWRDGWYSVPAGHIEVNETVTAAAIRETKEETGVDIVPENMQMVHTMHRKALAREYIDFFFVVKKWRGDHEIMELDKCDDLSWFDTGSLPENTLKYIGHAIGCYQKGIPFSEFGWNSDAE